MATSIWKKLADVGGFTRAGDFFNALRRGDFSHAAYVGNPYGFVTEYVNDIKNWDSESNINSATTESNNSGGIKINSDGSVDFSDISSLNQLGGAALEAVTGALPQATRMWNTAEAQKERDWQTEMSNTAYQRSMNDLQAAGLNPILAYAQGGATSGTGAVASSTPSSASSVGPILSGIGNILATVLDKDIASDKAAAKAATDAVKLTQSNSAITAKNNYYNALTKIKNKQFSRMK